MTDTCQAVVLVERAVDWAFGGSAAVTGRYERLKVVLAVLTNRLCHWVVMCSSQRGPGWGGIRLTKQPGHIPDHWKTPTPGLHIQTDDISFLLISLYLCPLFLFPFSSSPLFVPAPCQSVKVCYGAPVLPGFWEKNWSSCWENETAFLCFLWYFFRGVDLHRLKLVGVNTRSAAACQESHPQLWIIRVCAFLLLLLFISTYPPPPPPSTLQTWLLWFPWMLRCGAGPKAISFSGTLEEQEEIERARDAMKGAIHIFPRERQKRG